MPNERPRAARSRGGGHGSFAPAEKPKNFGLSIRKLAAYVKKSVWLILLANIIALASSVLNVVGPSYITKITNIIEAGLNSKIDANAVAKIGIFLCILYGASFVLNVLQGLILNYVSQSTTKRLKTDLVEKFSKLPLKFFDKNSVGDMLSRVSNDSDTIGMSFSQVLSNFVISITMFFGSLFMMFYTNTIMAIAGVLASALGMVLMVLIVSRSQKYFVMQQNELGNINGHIEENYSSHTVVKAYNGIKVAKADFDEINEKLYNSAWKSQFLSSLMMPLMLFIGSLGYVVVSIVGAILVMNQSIGFGVIVAFMIYIRMFTQPLSQLAQSVTSMQSAAAASERVFEILEQDEQEDESTKESFLGSVVGNLDFIDARFGYNEDTAVIQGFSATVKAGQKIAIVGPTGAGKTTIVNLLMRFYELWSGEIRIDDIPINIMKREDVRKLFGMVLQDAWLFEASIRDNIVYNSENVDEDRLNEVCKLCGIDHFIKTLPNGIDTVLDDKAGISEGQKQLVTIARAMIEDAPLLILDEATSSVDTRTEVIIQKSMDKLMEGRTSFVIAHRLSTIKNADLILVMNEGDIIESGSHSKLFESDGFYAKLYNSQFGTAV